ncbi:MAG TPA: substrate-binding domain-containing protein [Chthoniobacteraceae bacterium]|nr:substrate-binding domain-containing protein [Chthoniobacteraceae bacterium]
MTDCLPMTRNSPLPRLQPGERVRAYLQQEFLDGNVGGQRLPTTREIARFLEVSSPTVQAVIRQYVLSGHLEAIQGRGVFVKKGTVTAQKGTLIVGSNLLPMEGALPVSWSEAIYLGAVRESMRMNRSISFVPMAKMETEGAGMPELWRHLIERVDQVDMLMLFHIAHMEEVQAAYEAAGKPVVTINPAQTTSTSNFVAVDYFKGGETVARAFRATGRKRFLYIGPHEAAPLSMRLYLMGFIAGSGWGVDRSISMEVLSSGLSEEITPKLEQLVSASAKAPDAVLCAGDHLAAKVLDFAGKRGLSVPEEMSVVGGTGLQFSYPDISRIEQPMDQIGAEAIRMLCERLDHDNRSVPGKYLAPHCRPGKTTRLEENAKILPTCL